MHEGARAEKQRIRLETRLISEKLTPEYRQEASREIARQVLEHPLWKQQMFSYFQAILKDSQM